MSSRTVLARDSLNFKFQILQFFNRIASREYVLIHIYLTYFDVSCTKQIIKIRFRLNNKRFYRLDFSRWICIFY